MNSRVVVLLFSFLSAVQLHAAAPTCQEWIENAQSMVSGVIFPGEKDKLSKVTEDVRTELGDNNITTGTTVVANFDLTEALPTNSSQMQNLTERLFRRMFKKWWEEYIPSSTKIVTTTPALDAAFKADLVQSLSIGNAYSVDSIKPTKEFNRGIGRILRAVGANDKTLVGISKAVVYSDITESDKEVFFYLILNPETKKLVQYFIVEGTM